MTIDQALAWLRGLGAELSGDRWDPEDWKNAVGYGGDVLAHVRNVLPQLIGVVEAAQSEVYCSDDCECDLRASLTALAAAVEKESK